MIRPLITVAGTALHFRSGVAHALTFRGLNIRVFENDTSRFSSGYGYCIFDSDGSVIKYCRACSPWAVGRAIMEN